MHPTKTTLTIDRINILIHWVSLTGIAAALGWGQAFSPSAIVLILLAGAWTLLLTVFSLLNKRLPAHQIVSLAAAGSVGLLFAILVAYGNTGFLWAGMLPVLVAALYFRFRGGAIAAAVAVLVFGMILSMQLGNAAGLAALLQPAIVLVLTGLAAGMVSQQVGYALQNQLEFEQAELERQQRQEYDRIRALYRVTTRLTSTLNLDKVLDTALDTAAEVLIEPGMDNLLASAVLLFSGEKLVVNSARRFTASDLRTTIPVRAGTIYESLRSMQARKCLNPADDPELLKFVTLRECGAVYTYPIRNNQEIYGSLVFGHPDPEFFDSARTEILNIIGRQAVVALQNASLYRDLELEKERIMEIQEDARKQLARELHDGPTQSVAAIAMRVNFARRLIDRDPAKAGEELFKIEDLARRSTKEIRHMLFTLRPLALETSGLAAALISMAEKTMDTYEQRVVIEVDQEAVEELEMSKQGVVFYIVEEAVNNARKYAEAELIRVSLKKIHREVVLLEIEDNGVGFNVGEVDAGYEQRGSLGMVNMRERTDLLNGIFQISSDVGKGTHIRVYIPLNDDAGERLKRGRIE
ncbi:MAG: GAF domain-containing protein [Anaerolineales bacterium]|nr:GAF domain-containing protein [Anaerolineales bacterium]